MYDYCRDRAAFFLFCKVVKLPIKVVFEDSSVLYEVHQCIAADLKEYSNSNGSQVYYLVPECHFEKEL